VASSRLVTILIEVVSFLPSNRCGVYVGPTIFLPALIDLIIFLHDMAWPSPSIYHIRIMLTSTLYYNKTNMNKVMFDRSGNPTSVEQERQTNNKSTLILRICPLPQMPPMRGRKALGMATMCIHQLRVHSPRLAWGVPLKKRQAACAMR
jgi:hypothetical protein